MNITNIDNQLRLLQTIGYTLNVDEKIKLKLAHIQLLQAHPQLDQIKLWGKIQCLTKNYYIMIGLKYNNSYEFPHKYFYWAHNDFVFKQLPEPILQHDGFYEKQNVFFSGDPNKILINLQGEGQQQPPQQAGQNQDQNKKKQLNEQDQQLKKVPKKNFTELNRLTSVVRAIDNDAICVPKGSYQMTPKHQLHPCTNFYGLNENCALDKKSWFHFRAPQSTEGKKNIEQDTVIFSSNFLDNLNEDQPKGVWSLQLDQQKRNVNVRNLLWPGAFGFHQLNSDIFGNAYFGDGIKNIDLPFMI